MKGEKEIPGRNRLRKDRNVCEKTISFLVSASKRCKRETKTSIENWTA
jgi:hypothetical protein